MRLIRGDRSLRDGPLGDRPLHDRADEDPSVDEHRADADPRDEHGSDSRTAEERDPAADQDSLPQLGDPPRVAVLTTVRDEAEMLPRWVDYYGRQVGLENLLVLDDNSVDGSTKDLPCTVYRLPAAPWRMEWAPGRLRIVNGLAQALLACYDFVVFTDADEFLVPDPNKYHGLRDYLAARLDRTVIAPLALNVLHNPVAEPEELDHGRRVLAQRRHVKFAPVMCKPLLKRVPAAWRPAFHGINAPYEIDRDLLLLHLKYYDVTTLRKVAEHRRMLHETENRGSDQSAWTMGGEQLVSELRSWVRPLEDGPVPEFDATEPDLRRIVQHKQGGFYRSDGTQLRAMKANPLRRLPDRWTHAF
jgi:hypothetical protein